MRTERVKSGSPKSNPPPSAFARAGWNDSNVFSVFQRRGITPNEVNQFTKPSNTDRITTWILRGCK